MDTNVLCVDSDATSESVRRAMDEQGAPIAIVVDEKRHAIGVCSRLDLAQRSPSRRVETCMTPFVITMLDKSTVADALALIVERDLRHVPVLSEGHVVGIVTPRAVVRWLAQNSAAGAQFTRTTPQREGEERMIAAGEPLAIEDVMDLPIRDFMTESPHSIGVNQPLAKRTR